MKQLPKSAITIAEIAKIEDLHPITVTRLARERGFPLPITMLGRNKIFDWRQVNRFFRDRERAKNRRARTAA